MSKRTTLEAASTFPSVVVESNRPGITEENEIQYKAKRLVLGCVINNMMRKHGAEAVKCDGFDEVEIKNATGDELAVIGAQRAEPPMTPGEALEIGSKIYERWQKISGKLPDFCDTIHYVPIELTKGS